MYFILSKALFFLISPLNWLIFAAFSAFLSKNEQKRKRLLQVIFIGLVFFSNPFIIDKVYFWYETPFLPIAELKKDTFEVGIVLGGFSSHDQETDPDRLQLNMTANRMTDAIQLYKMGIIKKLMLSGGSGRLVLKEASESEETAKYLRSIGIPEVDILMENTSRNTKENAQNTIKILQEKYPNGGKYLLITSAFHIPRASRIFQKEGLVFKPFAAGTLTQKVSISPDSWLIPNTLAFRKWEIIIKEWVGLLFV